MDRDLKSAAEALLAKEIFGIDPGRSNGAIYRYHPSEPDYVFRMPREFEDIVDYFREQKEICDLPLAFLEIQNLRRGDKDGKQFRIVESLLQNYTEIIAALKVCKIPFIRVYPYAWQDFLRIRIPGEESNIRKRRYKDVAAGYNALIKPTLWNCDALLIAYFGLQKIVYDPLWVMQNIENDTNKDV